MASPSSTVITVPASTSVINLGRGAPLDTTAPSWAGATLSESDVTTTGYTVTASGPATDAVGVVGYEVSLDAGVTWQPTSSASISHVATGRTPGSTDAVRMRAFDAVGNRSTSIARSVTLAAGGVTYGVTSRTNANIDRMVSFSAAFGGGRYERFTGGNVILSGASATIGFRCDNIGTGGGVSRALEVTSYTLLVDGIAKATKTVTPGATTSSFTLPLGDIDEGWHVFDISVGPNETCRSHGFYVKKSASPPAQTWMPVVTGTYELEFQTAKTGLTYRQFQLAKVPSVTIPTIVPFDHRLISDRQGFSTTLNMNNLVGYSLIPSKFGDRHYPSRNQDGVLMTYSYQDYFYDEYLTKRPKMRVLDGPRGVGTLKFATHLQVSLREGSRKIYFSDGWRVGVVSEDGSVRTLAGWRHKSPPPHWDNPGVGGAADTVWGVNTEPQLELVGDWSSVPVSRQGFWEPWGIAWDESTLGLNTSVPPVGEEPEPPHSVGPVLFVADTHNNRIVKMQFLPDVRTPAVCTEFITGLSDPWSITWHAGNIYVTERTGHRISVWNSTTGVFVENIVSNPVSMSGVSASRFTFATTNPSTSQPYTITERQAADVVGPEGSYKSGEWLYYGSSAMRCIKRVNLNTKVVEMYLQLDADTAQATLGMSASQTYFLPWPDANSLFLNFSVSDGSFGPAGSVVMSTWSNKQYGTPVIIQPNNRVWDYVSGTTSAGQGASGLTYGSASTIGKGIMIYSGSEEGLVFLTQKGPMDPVFTSTYGSSGPIGLGAKAWWSAGYHLTHEQDGYGHYGLPLPWGESANMDTFLRAKLHTRIPTWRKSMVTNAWSALPASSVSGEANGRLHKSGAALQDTPTAAVLWMGPTGGGTENSDNSVKSLDLLSDSPTWVTRLAATASGSRTANASYYADSRPSARNTYASVQFSMRWNRLLTFGVHESSGTGAFSSNKCDAFNPSSNTWDVTNTFSDAAGRYSCIDDDGDVWFLSTVSSQLARGLSKWSRNTKTQGVVTDFGSSAGGPLAFDSRRGQLFSLSWGNGEEGDAGTEVRAFVYRNLYDPAAPSVTTVPTRTAVALNSIGGALSQFAQDKPVLSGMDYDSENDAFYFYDGRNADGRDRRGRVYVIKPTNGTSWDISILTLAETSLTPVSPLGGGVLSRFRYVKPLKGFVAYLDNTTPVWFLSTGSV